MAQSTADTTYLEKYKLSGEHGDGPELPLCVLIELLEEASFYTTRDAALTRFLPSDIKGARGPFEKTRDRLGYYLRKRKTEPDRLFRDGQLVEVVPDEEGEIRGTRAFRGATIKDLMKPRGKLRGKLGVRLLRALYSQKPIEGGRLIESLMNHLNKCKIDQLDQVVQALENDTPPACEKAGQIVAHIRSLDRTGLAQLLQEFGHQPFEPQLFNDGPPENPSFALDEPLPVVVEPNDVPEPVCTGNEPAKISSPPQRLIPFQKFTRRHKIFALVALVALAFTAAAQRVHFGWALDILKTDGIAKAYEFLKKATITIEDGHEAYRDLAFVYIRLNRYEEAQRVVHELLGQEDLSPKHYADCFLLLGQIKFATGRYNTALGMYHEAHLVYDTSARQNRSALGLAKTYLVMGKRHAFEEWYGLAIDLDLESRGEGNHAEMNHLSQVYHMLQGDYEAALDDALREWARVQASDNEDLRNEARVNLGMAYAFTGDLVQAQDYSMEAGDIAYEMGDQEKQVYNLITHVITNRRLQIPASQYALEQINARIAKHNDQYLKLILELALTD